ncbi:EXS-domain-containing protein [Ramicandelaber brevisporus]|nr:EXS-domain-containing protein [Ramicandelaber brevisporus]
MLADPNVAASSGNLSPASTINSDSAPELSLVHTFPLYFRVLLLAVLGVWAWATNIHGLEAAGISVNTIFDNNDDSMSAPKRRPGYVPVYKIAVTLSLLWIIGITLYGMLMRRSDTIDRAVTIAILAYVVFFFLVFQPFNWLEKSTRMAFAKSLRRIIFDPPWAARVLLSDVILADILTSFARVFADTYATGCDFYYHMFVTKSAPVTVIPSPTSNSSCNYTTVAPYLVSLPFLFRLRQCITEVYRAKHPVDRRRHIMNALKYLSALPVIFLSAAQKEDAMNSRLGVLFVCWSVAVIVNTLYSFYWDIAMDFDLGHISGRRAPAYSAKSFPFMLRPRLHFPDPMLYYTAIALDFILRIAWTLKLSWHLRIDTMTFGPFLMAFIEILRRWMWVYFRLEREWVYRELRSDQH